MGRLIIDGNSVFEIDEECMKRRRPPTNCDVEKYLENDYEIGVTRDSEKKYIENKRTMG